MFTKNKCSIYVGNNKVYVEASCLSKDTKETEGIANGSTCMEMDTGTLYFFDEENKVWRAWT